MFRNVRNIISILMGIGMLVGCQEGSKEYEATDSGLSYMFEKEGEGPEPDQGNIMIMNVSYVLDDGTELFNTSKAGGPMPVSYDSTTLSREGGLEEGLKMLSEGDSILLQYPIEDLIEGTFGLAFPDTLTRGSKVTVCIGLEKVLTPAEFDIYRAEQDQKRQQASLERNKGKIIEDGATIDAYLAENNLEAQVHESGLRYSTISAGTGENAVPGNVVRVNYTGRILNGTLFDSSIEETVKAEGQYNPGRTYEPYQFQLGAASVIQGWDSGIALVNKGAKAILYVPSSLAYGENAGSGVIGPDEILIFEVELVEVER